ncbi:hypothetical protein VQ056_33270 [Paenibacillus sp. JTLBN-2024]
MEAHYEPYMPMMIEMDRISKELRSILLELRMATGNREDKYRVWNVEKDIPGLIERLERIREQFVSLQNQMKSINPKTDNVTQMLKNGAADLKSILSKPNQIPYAKERIASVQESLESNRSLLMDSPLQLDQLFVAPLDAKLPGMTSNFGRKRAVCSNPCFIRSEKVRRRKPKTKTCSKSGWSGDGITWMSCSVWSMTGLRRRRGSRCIST